MPDSIYQQQIRTILDNIEVVNDQQLRVKASGRTYDYRHDPEGKQSDLFGVLSNLIYTEFYTTACHPDRYQPPEDQELRLNGKPPKKDLRQQAFLEQLRRANRTEEGFDEDWELEAVEAHGPYMGTKGNYRRPFMPGQFISESVGRNLVPGTRVRYYRRKDMMQDYDVFYYCFSQTVGDDQSASGVRLYFNIRPNGAPALVHALTTTFNRYQIPFDFKCLNAPDHYARRTDTAVLYLAKGVANYAFKVLPQVLEAVAGELERSVPAFTRLIVPGVGFAESSPSVGDSFGTSRAKVIAQGIIQAMDNRRPPAKWFPEVQALLRGMGFDLRHFYRNPNSHYHYQFPELN